MIDREALEHGRKVYRQNGFKPELNPYQIGTVKYNSFERGMKQAYNLNPGIHASNELEDKAEAEAAAQEAKAKQRSDEEKRNRKRQAYLDATKAG
jgi:hypothetical protein